MENRYFNLNEYNKKYTYLNTIYLKYVNLNGKFSR